MVISAPTAIVIRLSDRKLYRDPEVFREQGIETGRVAPFSVINPADAVSNHWRPPVIGPRKSGDTPGEKSESPGRRNAILNPPNSHATRVLFSLPQLPPS